MELHLPDIDGSELLCVLHEDKARRAIPVIIISADATPDQVARLKAAGARGYLTKPLDIEKFRQVVEENLTSKFSTTL